MANGFDFLKPSWKKLAWLFLVFLVAQVFKFIISEAPSSILAEIVSFVLTPAETLFLQMNSLEALIAMPVAKTIDLMWLYVVATILAKEISKEK